MNKLYLQNYFFESMELFRRRIKNVQNENDGGEGL
jgi:hypothetical protein